MFGGAATICEKVRLGFQKLVLNFVAPASYSLAVINFDDIKHVYIPFVIAWRLRFTGKY